MSMEQYKLNLDSCLIAQPPSLMRESRLLLQVSAFPPPALSVTLWLLNKIYLRLLFLHHRSKPLLQQMLVNLFTRLKLKYKHLPPPLTSKLLR